MSLATTPLVTITTPADIIPAGNPVNVGVEVLNAFKRTYETSSYDMSFSNVVADSSFILTLNDRDLEFKASSTPIDTGFEYLPGADITALANMFRQCAPLAEAFDIDAAAVASNTPLVVLKSRNSSDLLTLKSVNTIQIILNDSVTSVPETEGSRIKLLVCEYFTKGQIEHTKIVGSVSATPESGSIFSTLNDVSYLNGTISFDIKKHLFRSKIGHFSFPEEEASALTVHNIATKFLLLASGYSGNPPLSRNSISKVIYALPAKLTEFKQAELNENSKSFIQYLNEQQMWLTWRSSKKTDIYATERLYYLMQADGSVTLSVKKYYTDNTSLSENITTIEASKFQIIECRTGYLAIKSDADNGRKIQAFDIWLKNSAGTRITSTFSYTLDFSYQPWARYFLYKNRLGAFELLRTTGKLIQKLTTEKTFATNILPSQYTSVDQNTKQIAEKQTSIYTINCGYMTSDEVPFYQEFIESREVYWLMNGKAVPCLIQNNEAPVFDDSTQYSSPEFDLALGQTDDFTVESNPILPIAALGDFDIDFSEDYDI
jgi:hypothetical protein